MIILDSNVTRKKYSDEQIENTDIPLGVGLKSHISPAAPSTGFVRQRELRSGTNPYGLRTKYRRRKRSKSTSGHATVEKDERKKKRCRRGTKTMIRIEGRSNDSPMLQMSRTFGA
jgi:hypothetical protein